MDGLEDMNSRWEHIDQTTDGHIITYISCCEGAIQFQTSGRYHVLETHFPYGYGQLEPCPILDDQLDTHNLFTAHRFIRKLTRLPQ